MYILAYIIEAAQDATKHLCHLMSFLAVDLALSTQNLLALVVLNDDRMIPVLILWKGYQVLIYQETFTNFG